MRCTRETSDGLSLSRDAGAAPLPTAWRQKHRSEYRARPPAEWGRAREGNLKFY
jgi:hypothetical protein